MEPIPGFLNYLIDDFGRVFSIKTKRFLKYHKSKGYNYVRLYKNKKQYCKTVHRLVLLTFVGPSNLDVNHKNGIKTDNRLVNLEYCTKKQNMFHAKKLGLIDYTKIQGEGHGNNKLSAEQVIEIKYFETGTQTAIAKKYNITQSYVSELKRNIKWKNL